MQQHMSTARWKEQQGPIQVHGSVGGEGQVPFLVKEEEEEIAPQGPLRKSEDTEEKVWLLFSGGKA